MNSGVALAKTRNSNNMRYYPPTWLKQKRIFRADLLTGEDAVIKLSKFFHVSHKKTREHHIPYVRLMMRENVGFAAKISRQLDLTDNEIKYLLGSSHEHLLKNILQWSENQEVAQQAIESNNSLDVRQIKSQETVKEKQEIRQQRLF